jgi:pimeloyl-ACP methyl ester carboxylesterase
MRRTLRTAAAVLAGALVLLGCATSGGVAVEDRAAIGDTAAPATTDADSDDAPDDEPDDTGADTTAGGEDEQDDGEALDVEPLDWGPCDDPEAEDEALECATLAVPLDYEDPDGDTIDLALVRVPATGDRIGAVLFNPGGPGGSGFDPIAVSGTAIQSELGLGDFDVVGFDPRGVDRSGGIVCVDDDLTDRYLYLDDTPDTPDEEALLDEADEAFVSGCQERYGDTLRHYSTENTARDMDLIRAGLGDDQLSFLGISYGTYLGATYATLFPDRVRALVLDSAYEPNGDTVEEQFLTQLVGFEEAFDNWAAWCEGEPTCAFSADDVGARWDALRTQLDEQPFEASDGRSTNQAVLDTATGAALYSEVDWPVLAQALADAETGDGDALFALADAYNGRNPDGTFDTLFQSNAIIRCASGISSGVPDDPAALLARMQAEAPRFSEGMTVEDLADDSSECEGIVEGVLPVEIDYAGDGPVVVIGGTNDPATPIRWAEEMAAAMGPNARLVIYTGEGHGQLLVSSCVTDIMSDVLVDLELPDEGTVCDPDPVVERPEWWDRLPVPDGIGEVVALPAVDAALGLTDTLGYGETRTTTLGVDEATDAMSDALDDAGFVDLGSQDIPIDGTADRVFLTPDGDGALLLLVMGPEAFETDDLASAKPSVPEGETVVMLAYLPQ